MKRVSLVVCALLILSAGAMAVIAASGNSSGQGPQGKPAGAERERPGKHVRVGGMRADANANVASVSRAAREGRKERLSASIVPPAFDHEAFERDPRAYLDTVAPGRIYQTAKPGREVPALVPAGPDSFDVAPGGEAELAVRTRPRAPVTFTSVNMGSFSNGLTSITVRADAEGVARATFIASKGTLYEVSILAASPLASGRVAFDVWVEPDPAEIDAAHAAEGDPAE